MDTPENVVGSPISQKSKKNVSVMALRSGEDSGYITTTPSSADLGSSSKREEVRAGKAARKSQGSSCTPYQTLHNIRLQRKHQLLHRDAFLAEKEASPIQRKALKRQIAVEENDCISPSTSKLADTSVSEVMQNLVVRSPFDKTSSISGSNIDITDTGELITSDYVSSDQITPVHTQTEIESSPPSRKKMKRCETLDYMNLQRTPEKSNRCETRASVERKSAKRLNFTNQPLGTPEKNEILYPSLPITPPKKTPERRLQRPRVSRRILGSGRPNLCGRDFIDFLKMLGEQQNQQPALQKIFSYLNGDDIARMCIVSKIWRRILIKDYKSNRKRRAYLRDKMLSKENQGLELPPQKSKGLRQSMRLLKEIQNHRSIQVESSQVERRRSPPVSPGRRRFKMFVKAASMGSGQLTSCSRCGRPARVTCEPSGEHWAQCEFASCGYTFCRKCLCERHGRGRCMQGSLEAPSPSKPRTTPGKVGSKQSKRNLKRL